MLKLRTLLTTLCLLAFATIASAQAPPAQPPAAAPNPAQAIAEYNQTFAQWKDVLAKLRQLQEQFRTPPFLTGPSCKISSTSCSHKANRWRRGCWRPRNEPFRPRRIRTSNWAIFSSMP